MQVTRRRVLTAGVLGGVTAAAGACSRRTTSTSAALRKVTYVTGLGSYGREGAPWVASAKGYFQQVGLDVSIVAGAAGDSNLTMLAAGRAQFAEIDYTGAVMRAGAPENGFKDFRMVANLNNGSIVSIQTLKGRGVTGPPDLAGKTIAEATGSVIARLWPAYRNAAGITGPEVKWVDGTPTGLPQMLAAGTVHAVGLFIPGAPSVAAAAGRPLTDVVTLPYSRYLGDLYGNVIVTTAKLVQADPDLVHRFTTALLKGLDYMVVNPEESGQILHRAVAATAADTAGQEMRLLRPYTQTDSSGGESTGLFDPARVARSVALLASIGMIKHSAAPEDFIIASALAAQ